MSRILIVDDEPGVRESLRMLFKGTHEAVLAADGPAALACVADGPIDLVLLDLVMPGMDGLDVLRRLRELRPDLPVVMLTATRTVRTAVDAMKLGAVDYLTKPFDVDELALVVRRALAGGTEPAPAAARREAIPVPAAPAGPLRREADRVSPFRPRPAAAPTLPRTAIARLILGESPRMQAVRALVEQVARRRTTVLITGESGTGKEVVARAIHAASPRAQAPFVAVNCAAIPESLLESELFGHERGAFTDAKTQRAGRFEQANGGTLFLDEVGELPLGAQAKLLRVLEEPTFERVGGTRSVTVDVRLVAATNQDLKAMVAERKLREDLYYRLAVVPIALPPLRERREDIPVLARHFLAQHASDLPGARFTDEALARLASLDWPGNVRELRNAVERAVALATCAEIGMEDLPIHLDGERPTLRTERLSEAVLGGAMAFGAAEAEFERRLIVDALRRTGFVQTHAAQLLGI
ncbi:MAG TPA: sigma-54 dependent transcriptional regulator, partial [Thermodesulfobacteriota bacterium]